MMKTFSAAVVVVVVVAVVAAAVAVAAVAVAALAVAAVIVAVAVVVAVVYTVSSLCQAVNAWCDDVLDYMRPTGNTFQSPQRIISSAMKAIYFCVPMLMIFGDLH